MRESSYITSRRKFTYDSFDVESLDIFFGRRLADWSKLPIFRSPKTTSSNSGDRKIGSLLQSANQRPRKMSELSTSKLSQVYNSSWMLYKNFPNMTEVIFQPKNNTLLLTQYWTQFNSLFDWCTFNFLHSLYWNAHCCYISDSSGVDKQITYMTSEEWKHDMHDTCRTAISL